MRGVRRLFHTDETHHLVENVYPTIDWAPSVFSADSHNPLCENEISENHSSCIINGSTGRQYMINTTSQMACKWYLDGLS